MSEVLGLVPAAGHARRLGRLPCSKELLPLGWRSENGDAVTPCGLLLEGMARAGIQRALLLLRTGKWDLPAFFATGKETGVELAYRVVRGTASAPETLAAAAPFLGESLVALGFPDILIQPADAFAALLERQRQTGAEVVLALFPTDRADKSDMVEVADDGRLLRLWIKAGRSDLPYTWGLAVWTPVFTRLLVASVAQDRPAEARELYVGDLLQEAVEQGLTVQTVPFPAGVLLDVGTPEEHSRAMELAASGRLGRTGSMKKLAPPSPSGT